MRKKLVMFAAAVLILSLLMACSGCGQQDQEKQEPIDNIIKVGATSVPHAEILKVAGNALEQSGYTLEVVEYEDYDGINSAVEDGTLDANYFQHITYLNESNLQNGFNLVNAGAIHFEPLALYSEALDSLEEIEEGMTIAVPSEDTNEARALKLLETNGLITLNADADVLATAADVEENKLNLKIVEVEGSEIADKMDDYDAVIINGNFAIQNGFDFSKTLAVEAADSVIIESYANVIAVKSGNENLTKIEALYSALTSADVKAFIEEEYKGAVVTLF